ncbi:hypothetical protein Amsp01_015000 [Amycolatopsis sp. NBRC 101858]|nr:hypothetical protein Amsp01_015000 [Amycolatopsis sp. NBRC 101858]
MATRDRMISACGRASGFGVDCDICTGYLDALVTNANAPLTPAGRLRLAR